MSPYRLQCTPEHPSSTYVLRGAEGPLGEIRHRQPHRAQLHLGARVLELRHEEGAAVAAAGGHLLQRLFAEVRFSRSWTLRDGEQVLARAARHWHWRPARDHLQLWPTSDSASVQASAPGVARDLVIRAGQIEVGRMRISGWIHQQVELDWPALDPAPAALFMYAMHRAYGGSSSTGGASGD